MFISKDFIVNESEENYFRVANMYEPIWRFFKNDDDTTFHIFGSPYDFLESIDLYELNKYCRIFASVGIPILYADKLESCIESLRLKYPDIETKSFKFNELYPAIKHILILNSARLPKDLLGQLYAEDYLC